MFTKRINTCGIEVSTAEKKKKKMCKHRTGEKSDIKVQKVFKEKFAWEGTSERSCLVDYRSNHSETFLFILSYVNETKNVLAGS